MTTRNQGFALAVALAILAGIALPSLVAGKTCAVSFGMLLLCSSLLLAVAVWRLRQSGIDLLGLVSLYTIVSILWWPTAGACEGRKISPAAPSPIGVVPSPLILVILFFVAAVVGAFVADRRSSLSPKPSPARGSVEAARWPWVFVWVVGVASLLRYSAVSGALAGQQVSYRAELAVEGSGVYFWIGHLAIVAPVGYYLHRGASRAKYGTSLLLAAGSMLAFLSLGGRARAVLPIAALAIVHHRRRSRRRRSAIRAVMGGISVAVIAILFLYVPVARFSALSDALLRPRHVVDISSGQVHSFLLNDVDRYQELAQIAAHYSAGTYLNGRGVVGGLGPLGDLVGLRGTSPGRDLFRRVDPTSAAIVDAGPVPSLPGQSYMEAGLLGILLFGAGFGAACAVAARWALVETDPSRQGLASLILVFLGFFYYTDLSKLFEMAVTCVLFVGVTWVSKRVRG